MPYSSEIRLSPERIQGLARHLLDHAQQLGDVQRSVMDVLFNLRPEFQRRLDPDRLRGQYQDIAEGLRALAQRLEDYARSMEEADLTVMKGVGLGVAVLGVEASVWKAVGLSVPSEFKTALTMADRTLKEVDTDSDRPVVGLSGPFGPRSSLERAAVKTVAAQVGSKLSPFSPVTTTFNLMSGDGTRALFDDPVAQDRLNDFVQTLAAPGRVLESLAVGDVEKAGEEARSALGVYFTDKLPPSIRLYRERLAERASGP